ncbi:unnamed protein product [Rotaria sp. Silwood2]|nr:unnamed protein product [Rotaria sp. Silwood2]CAF3053299.1 unnamed protein product [Rotaria sp. Silwood2]CAF3186581.1 unnamed protein product [Rotaria sp. Silwood2]CAF3355367.1 unnamed protein product [Rotaria sp. Silwood2]CAF4012642.1 unnamed protein product [Rotaria sp. Silwood2]
MTTNKQNSNNESMITLSTNNQDEIKTHHYRFFVPDAELLSIPDEEDEADIDETTEYTNPENILPILPLSILTTDAPISIRPRSSFSQVTTSNSTKKSHSRSYKFVQLEQTLISANLLQNNQDRLKFNHDYRESLRENKFEEFLKTYYKKLQDHNEEIRQEYQRKISRTFTFVDLEKNFLARDPARDIKIVFIDDPITPSTQNLTDIHPNSSLPIQSNDAVIEAFYENRLDYLLENPSEARDEITLFARRVGELLHERLPRLSRVPHRVDIVDQRESKGNIDQRTLLQMKHKHALAFIAQRRQLVKKMMTQTKKNQIKMERLDIKVPLKLNNSSCVRELFERTTTEGQLKRPQTGFTFSQTTKHN